MSDPSAERTSKPTPPAAKQTPAPRATFAQQAEGWLLPVLMGVLIPVGVALAALWLVLHVAALSGNAAWRFALLPHFNVWHQLHQPQWWQHLNAVQYAGVAVWVLGVIILLWPMAQFARKGESIHPKHETHQLIKDGSFRYLMDPMFNGVPKMIFGIFLIFGSGPVLAWCLFFNGYIVEAILDYERQRMLEQYGDEYAEMLRTRPSKRLYRLLIRDPYPGRGLRRVMAEKAGRK